MSIKIFGNITKSPKAFGEFILQVVLIAVLGISALAIPAAALKYLIWGKV